MLEKLNEIIKDLAQQCLKKGLNEDYFKDLAFKLADFRDDLTRGYPSIVPTDKFKIFKGN